MKKKKERMRNKGDLVMACHTPISRNSKETRLNILSPLYSIFYKWDRTQDGSDISLCFLAFREMGHHFFLHLR